jgi:choline-sulfatase
MKALITLIPLSALCGAVTAFVFRRFSSSGTKQTVNRILAHIMEFRLFLDEPRLIFKAQRDLLRENLCLFRQIAIPCLIAAPFFTLVIWQADHFYGRAPLPPGEPVVVTAHSDTQLHAPADLVVETPAVRIQRTHEVSWRVRPTRPFSGTLPGIEIPWPRTTVLGVSWLLWFFAISSLSVVLLKRILPLLLIAVCVHTASAAEKTPVILISIDTMRADRVTPNIAAFAEKGTVFTQIDSQIPLTLPSHTSLMTSMYPFQNRVEMNGDVVPAGAVTLASVLRSNGYKTAAFIGSMILNKQYGLDQGFDVYDAPFGSSRVRRDAALVTAAAQRWLDKNRNEPVFAFLHLYDLHTPYTIPQVAALMPNARGYTAELAWIDQVLGRFRAALMQDGWWNKALVIVLADHGESLGDHGETSHGYFVYESTIHVPLLIHWPQGAPKYPDRVTEPGGLIDVAPTILDFLDIPAPQSFVGSSLLGHGEHAVYAESIYPQRSFGWAPLRALRAGQYKYIQVPRPELYDLAKDPGEHVNLIKSNPKEAASRNARIDALMAKYAPTQPQSAVPMSAHTREVLGTLGYTAGGHHAAGGPDPKDKVAEQEAYENGLAFLYSGHYDKAIAAFRKIVKEDPRNAPAQCALNEAYRRSGAPHGGASACPN